MGRFGSIGSIWVDYARLGSIGLISGLAQLDAKTTNLDAKKKNLGAERQKNRSRENAFAEVLPRRPKFGVRSENNRTVRFCDGHERRSRV